MSSFEGTLQILQQEPPHNELAAEYPRSYFVVKNNLQCHSTAALYETYVAGHKNLNVYLSYIGPNVEIFVNPGKIPDLERLPILARPQIWQLLDVLFLFLY